MIWRIRDRRTFAALRRGHRRRRGPLTVTFVHLDAPDPPRIAFAIGRSVGSAVERNRLRRRMRAAVRAQADALRPGTAYLVTARPGAADISPGCLARDLREMLESAGTSRGSS